MSMTDVGPDTLLVWDRTCRQLRAELGEDIYDSWFSSVQLEGVEGEKFKLSVPTRFLRSWIQTHYGEKILAMVRYDVPTITRLDISLRSVAGIAFVPEVRPSAEPTHGPERALQRPVCTAGGFLTVRPNVDQTFQTFCEGSSNALALRTMQQIAEKGRATPLQNPLYLYGTNGVGKTHLLMALVEEANANGKKALYTTAHQLMRWKGEFAKSEFVKREALLGGIEILAVDDLDLLTGKEPMALFARSLDGLLGRHFLVLGSAKEQSELYFKRHVLSRISAGMSLKIELPDAALRADLLRAAVEKARSSNPLFSIPESHFDRLTMQEWATARDLRGVTQSLLMHLSVKGESQVTEAIMEEVVWQKLAEQSSLQRIRVEDIIRVVCKHYGVSRVDVISHRRTANVVRPRQVAMYLAKTLTCQSLPEIGRRFGGRDHTTVLHAVRKIERLVETDRVLRDEVEALTKQLCPPLIILS